MARATNSLPVPLSPCMSTVLRRLATSRTSWKISSIFGTLADDVVKAVLPCELFPQNDILPLEVLHLDDPAHQEGDLLGVARLHDVLLSALFHRGDRGVDGRIRGDDDDRRVRMQLLISIIVSIPSIPPGIFRSMK